LLNLLKSEFVKEKGISILIIDDDLDLLMLLERSLSAEGHTIETAASLTEAEELLWLFEPDIILLDINVNGEDGRKLCWKIKHDERYPSVKVIVMSGFDCSAERAVLFGADDIVAKPFETDFLLYKISATLPAHD
jgi:DNA-binding response OmpR family regulator